MNWVTTNLRLPEDLYMELKMEAAKKRKSVAAIIRGRLWGEKKQSLSKYHVQKLLERMKKLSKKIAKENKGINFTQGLIEMRYEQ